MNFEITNSNVNTNTNMQLLNQSNQYSLGLQCVFEYLFSLQSETSRRSMKSSIGVGLRIINTTIEKFNWSTLSDTLLLGIINRLSISHSPNSINTILAAFKGIAHRLWLNEVISDKVYKMIKEVKGIRGSRVEHGRALSGDEIHKLFKNFNSDTTKNVRDAAILAVLIGCGLRRAECISLRYENIYLGGSNPYLSVVGKGNKERICFIPKAYIKYLKNWFQIRGDDLGLCFYQVNRYERIVKKPMTSQRIYSLVKEWSEDLNLDKLSPHDLRRTYASMLLTNGVDIFTVKDMMGHSSVSTTQRYDKRGISKMQNAIDILNKANRVA